MASYDAGFLFAYWIELVLGFHKKITYLKTCLLSIISPFLKAKLSKIRIPLPLHLFIK